MLKRQIAALTKSSGLNTDVCWNEYSRAAPFLKEFLDARKPAQVERLPLPNPTELAAA